MLCQGNVLRVSTSHELGSINSSHIWILPAAPGLSTAALASLNAMPSLP